MSTPSLHNKLTSILDLKKQEIRQAQQALPLMRLQELLGDQKYNEPRRFYEALEKTKDVALIAEIKPASPSAGDINIRVDIAEQARVYEQGGVKIISVLTDKHFKGEIGFLQRIRQAVAVPILRKDFIFDAYQIYESRYYGADAVLLIAGIMPQEQLQKLIELSHELGMGCLVEAHDSADLEKIYTTPAKVIGINSRDLKTFKINFDGMLQLLRTVHKNRFTIAESGIQSRSQVMAAANAGARGMLVGTALMRAAKLSEALRELQLL